MCCAHHERRGKPALPVPLNGAPAAADALVFTVFDPTRFPAPAAWAPGLCPPSFCRPVGGPLSAGAASERRLPPSPASTSLGRGATPGAAGSDALAPRPALGLVAVPYVTRLSANDCALALANPSTDRRWPDHDSGLSCRQITAGLSFVGSARHLSTAGPSTGVKQAARHPVPADCGLALPLAIGLLAVACNDTATNSENTAGNTSSTTQRQARKSKAKPGSES